MATAQHDALLALLRGLDADDWARPTDCAGWTVRDVVAHIAGLCEEAVRLRVMLRHVLVARRHYPALNLLDGSNAAQLDDRRGRTADQLLAELTRLAPRAVRARRRTPGLLRRIKPPGGFTLPPDVRFGYVVDVVVIRDAWMHRIDIARACGRALQTIESDADVVVQVIRDLDRYWAGPALTLELTGVAGGRFRLGDGDPIGAVRADAVELCRSLSGRASGFDVEVDGDPAAEPLIRAARVVF